MVLFLRNLFSLFICCVELNNIMNECTCSWVSLPGFRVWLYHCYMTLEVVFVQSLSRVRHFATPRTAVHQAALYFTISWHLLKLMFIESVMLSNHLILCHPLLLLLSISPSIRVFSNELALCIRWPKYWIFSFSISSFNEYSGMISFRIDWFDLFVVQGTLKGLLHNSILNKQLNFSLLQFLLRWSHLNGGNHTTVSQGCCWN